MKRIFTLLFLSLPCFVSYAQSVTEVVQVINDSSNIAAASIDTTVSAENPVTTTIAEAPSVVITAGPQVSEGMVKPDIAANALYKKNIIKLNVTSLLFNNYNITYERAIRRKMTLSVGYRFMPKSALNDVPLLKKGIEIADEAGAFDDSEDFNIKEDMSKMFMSNNAFTGELRFYTGKKVGARGFYVSLYGRYTDMRFDYDYEYEGENQTYAMPISIQTKGYGGGVMLGAQWLIAKRVTFDWNIVGGHFGKMTGAANGTSDLRDMPMSERRDLEEEIESLGEVGNKRYLEATVTDNGVNAKANGPFAGLRAGFTLGVAF